MFAMQCTLRSYIKIIITRSRQVILKIWRRTEVCSILHDIWYVTEHASTCSPVTADEKSQTPCINVIIIMQISKPTMWKCINKIGKLYIYMNTHTFTHLCTVQQEYPVYCTFAFNISAQTSHRHEILHNSLFTHTIRTAIYVSRLWRTYKILLHQFNCLSGRGKG